MAFVTTTVLSYADVLKSRSSSLSSTVSNGPQMIKPSAAPPQMITPPSTPPRSCSNSPPTSPTYYVSPNRWAGLPNTISPPPSPNGSRRGMTIQPSNIQPSITMRDIADGAILYLRQEEEISPAAIQASGIELGALGHPCLILGKVREDPYNPYDGEIRVAVMTSFQGKPLSGKSKDQQYHYLPIFPAPKHPMGLPTLNMARGSLKKTTYVKVGNSFTVHISMLKTFIGEGPMDKVLDSKSLETARYWDMSMVDQSPPRRSSTSSNGSARSFTPPPLIRRTYDPLLPPPFSAQRGDFISGYDFHWRILALDEQGFPSIYYSSTQHEGETPLPPPWY